VVLFAGQIGDWKNIFTKEQNQYFESVYRSKMQAYSLEFVWERQKYEDQPI